MKHIAKANGFAKRALSTILCGVMLFTSSGFTNVAFAAEQATSESAVVSTSAEDSEATTESNQAETEANVAVNLTPTLHGKLEFSDMPGIDTLEVSSQSSVSIQIVPDDGYALSGIVATDAKGNKLDSYLADDIFTFYIEGEDATVYAEFGLDESVNLAEVQTTSKTTGTLDYILANADAKYVGKKSKELTIADASGLMLVKETVFDKNQLPADIKDHKDVLDVIWHGLNPEESDNETYATALVDFQNFYIPLYKVSEGDYLVGLANPVYDNKDFELVQVDIAKNNTDAEMLDDIIYDKKTGLIYVPKDKYKVDPTDAADGELVQLASTQVQFTQFVDAASITDTNISFDVSVSSVRINGEIMDGGIATAQTEVNGAVALQLGEDVKARYSIDEDYLTVKVNDLPLINTDEITMYEYNQETGILTINVHLLAIHSVDISIEKPTKFSQASTIIANMFKPITSFAASQTHSGATINTKDDAIEILAEALKDGASGIIDGVTLTYNEDGGYDSKTAPDGTYAPVSVYDGSDGKGTIGVNNAYAAVAVLGIGTFKSGTVVYGTGENAISYVLADFNQISNKAGSDFRGTGYFLQCTIPEGTYTLTDDNDNEVDITFPKDILLPLTCVHVSEKDELKKSPGVSQALADKIHDEYESIKKLNKNSVDTDKLEDTDIYCKVLQIDKKAKTVYLGIMTRMMHNQSGAIIAKFNYDTVDTSVQVQKKYQWSDNVAGKLSWINGNPAYGKPSAAKFALYSGGNVAYDAKKITGNVWGKSAKLLWKNVDTARNYRLKETSVPKNFEPMDDVIIKSEDLVEATKANKTYTVTAYNRPILGSFILKKVPKYPNRVKNNSNYSIDGTQYTLTAKWDSTITFTETIQSTDGLSGYAIWDDIPLGSYTLKETKSGKGYALDNTTYDVTIEQVMTGILDGDGSAGYNLKVEDPNTIDPVNIVLHKVNDAGQDYGPGSTSLADATFHFKYYVTTANITNSNESNYTKYLLFEFDANTKYLNVAGSSAKQYAISLNKNSGCILANTWKYYPIKNQGTVSLNDFYNNQNVFCFPLGGSLVVTETKSPDGYRDVKDDSGWTYTAKTKKSDGTTSTTTSQTNFIQIKFPNTATTTTSTTEQVDVFQSLEVEQPSPILQGYKITKRDSKSNTITGQGDAKVGEVEFTLYNISDNAIDLYDGPGGVGKKPNIIGTVPVNGVVEKVKLKPILKNGEYTGEYETYTSKSYLLPPGKYKIVETSNNGPYKLTNKEKTYVREFTVSASNPDGYITDLTPVGKSLSNDVWRGGVSVQKYDADTLQKVPQGAASLAGAEFTIYNKSKSKKSVWTLGTAPEYTDSKEIKYGEAYCTIKTDATGLASTDSYVLPVGHYEIRETKAPKGYKLNDKWVREFDITANQQMVDITQIPSKKTDTNNLIESKYGVNDPVIRGGIDMYKSDKDRVDTNIILDQGDNVGQGDRTLKGYKFYVVSLNDNPVVVNNVTYNKNQVCYTLVTDENGHATSDTDGDGVDYTFPCGEYSIYEAPQGEQVELGYYIDKDWKTTVTIGTALSSDGKIIRANDWQNSAVREQIWRGGIDFVKYDWDRDTNVAQGDATLAGCEFSIYNVSKLSVYVNGTWYDPIAKPASPADIPEDAEPCLVLTTDANGVAKTAEKVLPYGSYYVVESGASKGYLVNPGWSRSFTIRKDGEYIHATDTPLLEPVIRGDVQIEKQDAELGKSEAMNGKDHGEDTTYDFTPNLSGIKFEIYNTSKKDVYVDQAGYGYDDNRYRTSSDGVWYDTVTKTAFTKKDLVTTITTHWNEEKQAYTAETVNRTLPYGTYLIREVATKGWKGNLYANDTYLMTDGEFRVFEIREDGVVVTADKSNKDLIWKNQVVRSDFEFEKRESGTNKGLWTAWVVENMSTGERHVVVTDKSGSYTSSYNGDKDAGFPHTSKTNGNDWILDKFDKGESIKMADTDYTCGTWFGLGEDGTIAYDESHANDDLGALPMGTYQIYEVKSDTNADYWDEPLFGEGRTFYIDSRVNYTEDLGTMENGSNEKPSVMTVAVHDETGEHVGPADESTTIVDTVSYTGLKAGRTYYIEGTLMCTDGSIVYNKDDAGNNVAVTAQSERFTVESVDDASGSIEVPFVFDARDYEGKDVVAFETIYMVTTDDKGNEKITVAASHKNLKDANQTVKFPKIGTTAVVSGTESHEALADGVIKITDTVAYENLQIGKKYTVKGTFFDVDDNDEVRDANGNPVTATAEFTPKETSGTVDVEFTFDATGLEGHKIVAFEEVYYRNQKIAAHADLEDTNQTIAFPKIGTTANFNTGIKQGTKTDSIIIEDVVEYSNVIPNREYTVSGILMNQETGKPVLDSTTGKEVTAETKFTPDKADGTVTVQFEFDGSKFENNAIVAFETLYNAEGTVVGKHEDIEDDNQTVYFPEVATAASYCDTGAHEGAALDKVSIVDYVTYKGFVVGKEYTLKGTLMDKTSNAPVMDAEGNPIVVEATFTPEKSSGVTSVTFDFDATLLAGHTVVVFEEVYDGDILIAEHKDIESADQSIVFPEVDTTVVTDNTTRFVDEDGKHVITDTVYYTNLTPGDPYKVKGYIVDATGKNVTAETIVEFTPEQAEGSVEVTYEFDTTGKAGQAFTVYESIYHAATAACCKEEVLVAQHHDLNDEDQTFHVVGIKTLATIDTSTEDMTVTDTVSYTGLEKDATYTVKGTLMNKETGKPYKIGDKDVTAETSFKAEDANGTTTVVFHVGGVEDLDTAVVFEKLYYNDVEIASHEDINDEDQTVRNPKISTVATYGDTNINQGPASKDTVIKDTVKFSGLIVGQSYVMKGTLYDKTTNKLTDITAETTFKAEKSEGSVVVTFKFDATAYAGHTFVVFEQVVTRAKGEDGKSVDTNVVKHENADDADQTVYFPSIDTELKDAETGEHLGQAVKTVKLVDRVTYTNLIPGKKYTVKGTLMDKSTGKALLDVNKHEITATADVTPKTANGYVDITFTFKDIDVSGKKIVAFETVSHEGHEVATHTDIKDDDQTVVFPEIATSAVDAKTKNQQLHIEEGKSITIVDTVTYKNLIPGKTYTVTGVLMDKATGKELTYTAKADPKKSVVMNTKTTSKAAATTTEATTEVTTAQAKTTATSTKAQTFKATATFKAEKSSGKVEVKFTVPSEAVLGKTVVAFETLVYNDKTIATHENINDKKQTVYGGSIKTVATGSDNRSKVVSVDKKVKIVDAITYTNFVAGAEYTVVGQVIDKNDGNKVISEAKSSFKVTKSKATVTQEFTVDTSKRDGHSLVCYEIVYDKNNNIIAVHKDLNDKNQTVTVKTTTRVQTGIQNHSRMMMMLALMLMCAAVLVSAGTVVYRRKKSVDNSHNE